MLLIYNLETIKHSYDRIDAHIDNISDEIEIKIESLKMELDGINLTFKKELENIRKKAKE